MMPESENLNLGRSRYVLKVVGLDISEPEGSRARVEPTLAAAPRVSSRSSTVLSN